MSNTPKNPGSGTIFKYKSGQELHATMKNGEPIFLGADACAILGTNASNISKILHPDEYMLCPVFNSGQVRNMTFLTESGLYTLVFRSRKPVAQDFKRWLAHEVLPAIRKDGMYVMGEEKVKTGEMSPDELILLGYEALMGKAKRLEVECANQKSIINDNLVYLTLDAWRALNSYYLTKSQVQRMAWNLKKTLERQGLTVPTEEREYTLSNGEVIDTVVKIYPKAMLDQAAKELGIEVNMKFDLVAKAAC